MALFIIASTALVLIFLIVKLMERQPIKTTYWIIDYDKESKTFSMNNIDFGIKLYTINIKDIDEEIYHYLEGKFTDDKNFPAFYEQSYTYTDNYANYLKNNHYLEYLDL